MKAGVFRNHIALIYVTSDQRVTAFSYIVGGGEVHTVANHGVSYKKRTDTVHDGDTTFTRVEGDFGYKPEAAVAAARRAALGDLQHNANTPPVGKVVSKDGNAMGSIKVKVKITDPTLLAILTHGNCGKQSARKHRKAGHIVTKVSPGRYSWTKRK